MLQEPRIICSNAAAMKISETSNLIGLSLLLFLGIGLLFGSFIISLANKTTHSEIFVVPPFHWVMLG